MTLTKMGRFYAAVYNSFVATIVIINASSFIDFRTEAASDSSSFEQGQKVDGMDFLPASDLGYTAPPTTPTPFPLATYPNYIHHNRRQKSWNRDDERTRLAVKNEGWTNSQNGRLISLDYSAGGSGGPILPASALTYSPPQDSSSGSLRWSSDNGDSVTFDNEEETESSFVPSLNIPAFKLSRGNFPYHNIPTSSLKLLPASERKNFLPLPKRERSDFGNIDRDGQFSFPQSKGSLRGGFRPQAYSKPASEVGQSIFDHQSDHESSGPTRTDGFRNTQQSDEFGSNGEESTSVFQPATYAQAPLTTISPPSTFLPLASVRRRRGPANGRLGPASDSVVTPALTPSTKQPPTLKQRRFNNRRVSKKHKNGKNRKSGVDPAKYLPRAYPPSAEKRTSNKSSGQQSSRLPRAQGRRINVSGGKQRSAAAEAANLWLAKRIALRRQRQGLTEAAETKIQQIPTSAQRNNCQSVFCDFDDGHACKWIMGTNGHRSTMEVVTDATGGFLQGSLVNNGVGSMEAWLELTEEMGIVFEYSQGSSDVTMKGCCGSLRDCAEFEATTSDKWKSGALSCPKGTTKIIIECTNHGSRRASCKLDDIRLVNNDYSDVCG